MAQKKYQVFVSSTFRDLVDERQDAIRNILDLKHIPAGMELFPASDLDQLEYIKKVIDECDYYLLIVGGRYGSMDASGVSYTEREYEYALKTGKTVIAFVHSDLATIPVGKSETSKIAVDALNAFRAKVMSGRLVRTWATRQELEPLVLKSLVHAFNDTPQVGWIRGDSAASEVLLEQSNALLQENAALKDEIARLTKETVPAVDNIATLNDYFQLRYQSNHISQTRSYQVDRTAKFNWRQIFLAVAGQLEKPKTDSVIEDAIKEALNEVGAGNKLYSLNETDRIRIKVQLIALGYIKKYVSKTTSGGVAEFLSLTESGQVAFIEGMVVRIQQA